MKTNWIVLKTSSLLPPIMFVIFAILTSGCEEVDYVIHSRELNNDTPKSGISESRLNEIFVVDPTGTFVIALNGTVQLYFSEGSVHLPTRLSISSFPISDLNLEGRNMQKRGILIESTSEENRFNKKVRIWLNYDLDQFEAGTLQEEDPLTIFSVDPGASDDTRIESIGNCSKDFSYPKIKGYICKCGYYVVGKK